MHTYSKVHKKKGLFLKRFIAVLLAFSVLAGLHMDLLDRWVSIRPETGVLSADICAFVSKAAEDTLLSDARYVRAFTTATYDASLAKIRILANDEVTGGEASGGSVWISAGSACKMSGFDEYRLEGDKLTFYRADEIDGEYYYHIVFAADEYIACEDDYYLKIEEGMARLRTNVAESDGMLLFRHSAAMPGDLYHLVSEEVLKAFPYRLRFTDSAEGIATLSISAAYDMVVHARFDVLLDGGMAFHQENYDYMFRQIMEQGDNEFTLEDFVSDADRLAQSMYERLSLPAEAEEELFGDNGTVRSALFRWIYELQNGSGLSGGSGAPGGAGTSSGDWQAAGTGAQEGLLAVRTLLKYMRFEDVLEIYRYAKSYENASSFYVNAVKYGVMENELASADAKMWGQEAYAYYSDEYSMADLVLSESLQTVGSQFTRFVANEGLIKGLLQETARRSTGISAAQKVIDSSFHLSEHVDATLYTYYLGTIQDEAKKLLATLPAFEEAPERCLDFSEDILKVKYNAVLYLRCAQRAYEYYGFEADQAEEAAQALSELGRLLTLLASFSDEDLTREIVNAPIDPEALPQEVLAVYREPFLQADAITVLEENHYDVLNLRFCDDQVRVIGRNGKYGLVSDSGTVLVPVKYDEVNEFYDSCFYELTDYENGESVQFTSATYRHDGTENNRLQDVQTMDGNYITNAYYNVDTCTVVGTDLYFTGDPTFREVAVDGIFGLPMITEEKIAKIQEAAGAAEDRGTVQASNNSSADSSSANSDFSNSGDMDWETISNILWNPAIRYTVVGSSGGYGAARRITSRVYQQTITTDTYVMVRKANGLWNYVDSTGREVLSADCEACWDRSGYGVEATEWDLVPYPPSHGFLTVKQDGKMGIYSMEGVCLLEPGLYDEIVPASDSRFWVRKGNLWGLLTFSGSEIERSTDTAWEELEQAAQGQAAQESQNGENVDLVSDQGDVAGSGLNISDQPEDREGYGIGYGYIQEDTGYYVYDAQQRRNEAYQVYVDYLTISPYVTVGERQKQAELFALYDFDKDGVSALIAGHKEGSSSLDLQILGAVQGQPVTLATVSLYSEAPGIRDYQCIAIDDAIYTFEHFSLARYEEYTFQLLRAENGEIRHYIMDVAAESERDYADGNYMSVRCTCDGAEIPEEEFEEIFASYREAVQNGRGTDISVLFHLVDENTLKLLVPR